MSTKVTFARPWTDGEGKEHKADSTASLDDAVARQLFYDGAARPADETPVKKES